MALHNAKQKGCTLCTVSPTRGPKNLTCSTIHQDCLILRKHLIDQPNELVSDLAPPLGVFYLEMQYQNGA